jgi:hypothetical protein
MFIGVLSYYSKSVLIPLNTASNKNSLVVNPNANELKSVLKGTFDCTAFCEVTVVDFSNAVYNQNHSNKRNVFVTKEEDNARASLTSGSTALINSLKIVIRSVEVCMC